MVWWFGKKQKDFKAVAGGGRIIRARFDGAQTTADNARHWAGADSLSADSAMGVEVRRKLRERSRYEVANNSYAKGITLTLANDCIGTGPRLQLLTDSPELNRIVEFEFSQWADSINLAEKLRTMRMSKSTDGEAFGMLTANFQVKSPVKLDMQLIEADRVTTPMMVMPGPSSVDGIEFDSFGNPSSYCLLKNHPGDIGSFSSDYEIIGANSIVHWFRMDRPGQHRGIPEITPALPLFAQLRRYTLAVLSAAETAANFAAVLYTDSPANSEAASLEPMDIIDLQRNSATTLPEGWKLGQIDARQPATSYTEFKREILNEIARCLNIPLNIALCNSSGYNYASGRLDHQTYYKSIRVEQAHLGEVVLDRIFNAWLDEAILSLNLPMPQADQRKAGAWNREAHWRGQCLPRQWFFDGVEHVDPAKEANAQATRLASNTTTLAAEYARQGKDWEVELRQRAKEKILMTELGLIAKESKNAKQVA